MTGHAGTLTAVDRELLRRRRRRLDHRPHPGRARGDRLFRLSPDPQDRHSRRLRQRRGAFQIRFDRQRRARPRHSLLDLARHAGRLSGTSAGRLSTRSASSRSPARTPRSASPSAASGRSTRSAPTAGCAIPPRCVRAQATQPTIYTAASAQQLNLMSYFKFLFGCARDPNFTTRNVMAAIDRHVELSMFERLALQAGDPAGAQGSARRRAEIRRYFRQPRRVGTGAGGHVQSLQGAALQSRHVERRASARPISCRSGIRVARGNLAALGRQQRFGRRA